MPMVPTVLVVEDDPALRETIAEVLADEGYRVVAVVDGSDLWEAAGGWPSLILLDLRMPGLDGEATLAHLQADPAAREIPVVVMSGSADLAAYAGRPGVAAILPKPFDLEDLLSLVATWAGPAG